MKKFTKFKNWLACWALSAALIGLIFGSAYGDAPVHVAVSIEPLADFVRQIGAADVDVIILVPPGASPHTYELKPSQVAQVSRARLLVLIGAGLEYWADNLVKAVANPDLRVIDTSKGIPLIGAGSTSANPHIWLDVRQAMTQVKAIEAGLIQVDPARAEAYRSRSASYLNKLASLDEEIAREVKSWKSKEFIAFHPAWVYFARRYGLKQAGVIEQSPGREPSPAELARIVETAKRIGARAIFAEPQLSSKAADTIAQETGARVIFLDPLGSSLSDRSYISMMRYNVAQMAKALK
ncbi:MAG TPA: metal ABC transporter substrate-binding protein [Candidatus Binatia bacterium]